MTFYASANDDDVTVDNDNEADDDGSERMGWPRRFPVSAPAGRGLNMPPIHLNAKFNVIANPSKCLPGPES